MARHFCVRICVALCLVTGLLAAPTAAAAAGIEATYVYGQAGSFTTSSSGSTASKMTRATAFAFDNVRHRLFVADDSLSRVVVYNLNADNTAIDDTADFVIGQTGFGLSGTGTTATTMNAPRGLVYDATKDRLYVADSGNRRVMVFDGSAIATGMAASFVLGQPTTGSNAPYRSQSGISGAGDVGLSADNRYLLVSDTPNNRVMVWDTSLTMVTGMNATAVLGQTGFGASGCCGSSVTMGGPSGIAVDADNKAYFVDAFGSRVVAVSLNTITTGMAFTQVIGQPDFNATSVTDVKKQFGAVDVTVGAGRVYVLDNSRHRVLAFDGTSATNYPDAIAVYGQPDFTSTGANTGGVTSSTLAYPQGVGFDPLGMKLLTGDENRRILVWPAAANNITVSLGVNPSFTFTVGSRSSACNGVTPTGTSTATGIALGSVNSGVTASGAQDLTAATNANGGFTVYQTSTGFGGPKPINNVAGTNATPAAFGSGELFGYTVGDPSLSRFSGPLWAAVSTTASPVLTSATGTTGKTGCVLYQAQTVPSTPAGAYAAVITYTAVPTF